MIIAETLSKVTGRQLLHDRPHGFLRAWYWSGEENEDELQRLFAAARKHYGITDEEIGGRLFVGSGRQRADRLVIAKRERNGTTVLTPVVENLVREIRDNGIDSFTVDPFVKSHEIEENDNNAIDQVASAWGIVASEGNCAVNLWHHPRKPSKGPGGSGAVTIDDGRGAGALICAVRVGRTMNKMTADEAEKAGVQNPWAYVRLDDGKINNAPPQIARWVHLQSVVLANGDSVGVATPWKWPDTFQGVRDSHLREIQRRISEKEYRKDPQSKTNWVGDLIADVVGALDPTQKRDKHRINDMLATWIKTGALKVGEGKGKKGKPYPIIVLGRPTMAPPTFD
jgi:hypothetical protein